MYSFSISVNYFMKGQKNMQRTDTKKELSAEKTPKKSVDRRVRKTKDSLRHCLAELLKKKKIQEITVKELTEMSDINRGTFYLHYRDVFDLLEQIEAELMEEFNSTLNRFDSEVIKAHPAKIFDEVFSLIKKNSDIVEILLGENGDIAFMNSLMAVLRDKCLSDFMEDFRRNDNEHFDIYYSYIINGCLGIVRYWIENGLKESPDELSLITEQIVNDGVRGFVNKQ